MSLAMAYFALHLRAAMEEAPQPLPTSRTILPATSSGFSSKYLNDKEGEKARIDEKDN